MRISFNPAINRWNICSACRRTSPAAPFSKRWFVETLLAGAKDDSEQCARFLQIIEKHADRLAYLIDDLLTVSRLESGRSLKPHANQAPFVSKSSPSRRGFVTVIGHIQGIDNDDCREANPGFTKERPSMLQVISDQPSDTRLASDLRLWLSDWHLVTLALEATQKVDWSIFYPDSSALSRCDYRPQMMLSLLTYCYAAGLYESERIAREIFRDQALRYLCAETFPDAQTLRRFRRRHHGALKQCLVDVLKHAWKSGQWSVVKEFPERASDRSRPCTAGDARFAQAAEERIQLAVLMDGMALED
jgi:hypothetical protein